MSRYRRSSYRRNTHSGSDFARRHLDEAEAFSREIGGYDKDVKEYFFNLSINELNAIFVEYGKKFGAQSESYARKTFRAWRTGKTGMSGLVSKRIFDLLPPRMSVSKKYELAENIWRHFSPTSKHYYTIGPLADVHLLANTIASKLDDTVTAYNIPEHIKNRFMWLAAGDVSVEEKLLNHLRQLQKNLALQKVKLEIPVLQRQINNNPEKTLLAYSEIQIHKHVIRISLNKKFSDKIQETSNQYTSLHGNHSWIWWIVIAVAIILFFYIRRSGS